MGYIYLGKTKEQNNLIIRSKYRYDKKQKRILHLSEYGIRRDYNPWFQNVMIFLIITQIMLRIEEMFPSNAGDRYINSFLLETTVIWIIISVHLLGIVIATCMMIATQRKWNREAEEISLQELRENLSYRQVKKASRKYKIFMSLAIFFEYMIAFSMRDRVSMMSLLVCLITSCFIFYELIMIKAYASRKKYNDLIQNHNDEEERY